jgi:hypothetical protein
MHTLLLSQPAGVPSAALNPPCSAFYSAVAIVHAFLHRFPFVHLLILLWLPSDAACTIPRFYRLRHRYLRLWSAGAAAAQQLGGTGLLASLVRSARRVSA